ncbi:hypothetical protein Salat_1878300 [Sesamum alatum]|uniref:5'-3' DNA helicase ZGRF1-like N-terminal domain-containing protein n=1 Tax=Sesamum alatum TaxID=300844 RepID=A0AAE2CI33_9LAMI|nr:hypothetical protein Salat_1878300 [Sesamum alatum]
MEDAQRWSVTYTKHVKQKRKVYQDGFLELQSSRHKVMLFDEWDKLLESRFVKKDDVIKSGETLAFDCYLVDIGELCGGYKPTSTLNQGKDKKVEEKSGSFYSSDSQSNSVSVDRKPAFGRRNERVICLSPSQKMIRDFKKSEINKFGSSPSCMNITKSNTTEWQVLYTTQITQKAKKFHDGFLQLLVRGSQGRQVMLYDTNRRQLNSRFLKKDERVCSGESLAFEGHLVEIGQEEGDHKPVTHSNLHGKYCKVVEKTDLANHQVKIPTNNKFPAGKIPDKTSPAKLNDLNDSSSKVPNAKLSRSNPANEPRRAVHDILSILRQPIHRKVVTINEPSAEERPELYSSDVRSDNKNPIKEYAEECTGSAREELREKTSDHDNGIKVLKPKAVEVLVAAETCPVSENGRESQARSSDFCLRSGTTSCIVPILDVECTDRNRSMASSSSKDAHVLVAAALSSEGQTPIESATLTRSNEDEEPENPPEICPYEDIMSETNAAAKNVLSSTKLPKDKGSSSRCHEAASSVSTVPSNDSTSHELSGTEEKTQKLDLHTKEKDEFPSFDLGF